MQENKTLSEFFQSYITKNSVFLNKKVLQSQHFPSEILHRSEQLNQVASVLAPALKREKPSNLFIYGKTGTGKSLTVLHTKNELETVAKENKIPLKILYTNCKMKKIAATEYRLIAELGRSLDVEIPATGLPTDEVYNIFFNKIESLHSLVIIILDEIDGLISKNGDEVLYNLTRTNSELQNSVVSLIGISNDLRFTELLDPRVQSSLSEEEIVFPPYNAIQLQDILRKRAAEAFKSGSLVDGVIEKCSAYAAREHGDARRALELLRVAAELADRTGSAQVLLSHLDMAEEKIEHDRMLEVVQTHPKQHQAVLLSIIKAPSTKGVIQTGNVYDSYREICKPCGLRPLTQRRVSDIISEFDMLGLINAKVLSYGRYGRTRNISVQIPSSVLPKINKTLHEALNIPAEI